MATPRPRGGMTRRDVTKLLAAAGAGVLTGGLVHGAVNERHRIGLTHATLPVSGLPGAFEGLRVALLTDLHLSPIVDADDIAKAVALTLEQKPDLIVLGGDYVTWGHDHFVGPVADLLAPLTAPLGVLAVLGNHDSDDDVTAALKRNKFEVLRDERTRIVRRGDALDFVGLRYWTRQVSTIAKLIDAPGNVNILLAHDPRRINEAAELNIPLVLSGHTHGGQITWRSERSASGRPRRRLLRGLGQRGETQIYVSRGLGTVVLPLRYGCLPEVSLLELRSAE